LSQSGNYIKLIFVVVTR